MAKKEVVDMTARQILQGVSHIFENHTYNIKVHEILIGDIYRRLGVTDEEIQDILHLASEGDSEGSAIRSEEGPTT